MVSMLPVQPSRSAMKARHNSIANTAASSANLQCETFELFFLRVLRNSNWSVVSESFHSAQAIKIGTSNHVFESHSLRQFSTHSRNRASVAHGWDPATPLQLRTENWD